MIFWLIFTFLRIYLRVCAFLLTFNNKNNNNNNNNQNRNNNIKIEKLKNI